MNTYFSKKSKKMDLPATEWQTKNEINVIISNKKGIVRDVRVLKKVLK